MENMFLGAMEFNQSLNDWDVSSVIKIRKMFSEVWLFNQPLDKWNVSQVTNMNRMFSGAKRFISL